MNSQERLALLAAARRGDTDARGRLLDNYRPYIRRIVHAFTKPSVQARADDSDFIQEAQLEALRTFDSFSGSTVEEFTGWLRQIVVRTTKRKLRDIWAQQRDPAREAAVADAVGAAADSNSSPSAQAMRHEAAAIMAEALDKLPHDMRRVLIDRHVDELSYANIAERLGKSADAVRQIYVRALRRLRDLYRG